MAVSGKPRCAEHQRGQYRQRERSRDPAQRKFYGSRAWRLTSERIRRERPVCEACQRVGRTAPSQTVDHRDGDWRHGDDANLVALSDVSRVEIRTRSRGEGARPCAGVLAASYALVHRVIDRLALEAELRVSETFSIGEWCRITGWPVEDWPAARALASYVDLSVARFTERISPRSNSRGLELAGEHFDIEPETLKTRFKRRRRQRRTRTKVVWASPPGTAAAKKKANNALNQAVRDGKVVRPAACEKCGAEGRVVGHHRDYGKPLEVEWLCYPCHGRQHWQDAA